MPAESGPAWPGRSADLVAQLAEAGLTDQRRVLAQRYRVHRFNAVPRGLTQERPVTVDQTHLSVVVGERLVVKWMRTPIRRGRAVDLMAHLAAVGFPATPTPYAAVLDDRPAGGPDLVALVTRYLPGARDGWDWCVEAVVDHLRGAGPADIASGLGELTAALHAALATPSAVFAEPAQWSVEPTWSGSGVAVLTQALGLAAGAESDQDGRWLVEHADAIRADVAGASQVHSGWVMPLHGDLHVGQVLRWRGGDAVADFDGNPAVEGAPQREPAARDVAQLRTSLAHVAQIANRRTEGSYRSRADDWTRRAMDDFLVAYVRGLAEVGLIHLFEERLLRPFEVEQECRELVYAQRFLPRWRYAPMAVLRSWYE